MAEMTMAPMPSPAMHILLHRAFSCVGLDCFSGAAREDSRRSGVGSQGGADCDGGGDGKCFYAHISLLLDIVGSGMWPVKPLTGLKRQALDA